MTAFRVVLRTAIAAAGAARDVDQWPDRGIFSLKTEKKRTCNEGRLS
jgi:hypothetical protein